MILPPGNRCSPANHLNFGLNGIICAVSGLASPSEFELAPPDALSVDATGALEFARSEKVELVPGLSALAPADGYSLDFISASFVSYPMARSSFSEHG